MERHGLCGVCAILGSGFRIEIYSYREQQEPGYIVRLLWEQQGDKRGWSLLSKGVVAGIEVTHCQ